MLACLWYPSESNSLPGQALPHSSREWGQLQHLASLLGWVEDSMPVVHLGYVAPLREPYSWKGTTYCQVGSVYYRRSSPVPWICSPPPFITNSCMFPRFLVNHRPFSLDPWLSGWFILSSLKWVESDVFLIFLPDWDIMLSLFMNV